MIGASGLTGRPLRALAGLGLMLALWIGVRLPAMHREMQALALLAAPPASMLAPTVVMLAPLGPMLVPPPMRAGAGVLRLPLSPPPPLLQALAVPADVPQPVASPVPSAPPPAVLPPAPLPPAAPALPAAAPLRDPAFSLAAGAYGQLRAGQRRMAAALFDAALAVQPGNKQWQADRAGLGRRWQVGGFALLRGGGALPDQPGSGLPGFAASPVLGGGQVGSSIAYLPDPYARRSLALVARANVAADARGVRADTAQLAFGLRQTLLPGVSLSVERLVPLGDATRGAFTARLAAGGRLQQLGQRLEGYGEAGVLDTGQIYAGGQARARLVRIGPVTLHAATWASIQTGTPDAWRVDAGPSLAAQVKGIRLEADWRQRASGNAAPGSGPVLTVSAGF